ncbi:MAG: glycosyltransferase family 4 protein [Phycisphaerae bacterium]|jgi:glycosyltransferase involved in cell wall biosynthesis|nr:glycosyltransferase family 4 protein [Phycisphaerae bacterium]MBT6270243.1 glycosyltransferase family 4 protein [Phycisphaerae bacterium]MBT6282334.1 glycosyltransferase family 4 protein [Phycisphaerae bacterium]
MKIGIYVSVISGQKGFENNVSGHIQVPLRSIEELQRAGHEVHLITNKIGEGRSLPFCLDESNMDIHYVTDARERGGVLERTGKQTGGMSFFRLRKQVQEIKAICKEQKLDVLHLFGYNRTAHLAGGLCLFGLKIPVVTTMFGAIFPERLSFLTKRLWNRIDAVVTATEFVKNKLESNGIPTKQIRHGVIRDLVKEKGDCEILPKHRVLFWRDMTIENGADVALAAFEKIAPIYPDISFNFAVRKHWEPIEGVEEVESRISNFTVYHFPYSDGITLPKLLLESLCVVMPIRQMSIDPQLVIAETLASGVPIITTNQRSNPEFIQEGETGCLVPLGDVDATTNALDLMLADQEKLLRMGERAKEDISSRWNWNGYASELLELYKSILKK